MNEEKEYHMRIKDLLGQDWFSEFFLDLLQVWHAVEKTGTLGEKEVLDLDLSFLIGAEVITKSCCQGVVEAVPGTDVTVFLPETGEHRKYSALSSQSGSIYDRNFLFVKNPELRGRMTCVLAEEEEEIHDLLACYDD